jgi:hypothetical protein
MLIVRIRSGSGYYVVSINREMVPDEWNEGHGTKDRHLHANSSLRRSLRWPTVTIFRQIV